MYGLIVFCVTALMSPDLSLWYSQCSQGNWHNAAEEAASLVSADSSNTEAMAAFLISGAFSGISEFDLLEIEAAVPADSLSPLFWAATGLVLMENRSSSIEQMEDAFQKSIQLDSTGVFGWYLLGHLHEKQSDTLTALHCYTRAAEFDSDFLPARLQLGRMLRDVGRQNEALAEFRKTMDTETSSGVLAFVEYLLLAEETGSEIRSDSLERMLLQANPGAYVNLAYDQFYIRPDVALAAAVSAERTLTDDNLLIDISETYLYLGEYSAAVSASGKALAASIDSMEILGILGEALFEQDNMNESKKVFLALLNLDPFSIDALNFLGSIAEQEARTPEAVDYFLRTLELDPFNIDARNHLKIIAGDSYDPDIIAETLKGFSASASVDLSIEKGTQSFLECGGSTSLSYRFDRRGSSINVGFGGRTISWEEIQGLRIDTLNTETGWASIEFDYWLNDNYYLVMSSFWDRQRYTVRPWQVSSYIAGGWQHWISSWFRFSPEIGLGSVNAKWLSHDDSGYSNTLSVYVSTGLWYRKPHTFIREAGISGDLFFPPDNPENFISHGALSIALRTWNPLYITIGYQVDYTKNPEVPSWEKFNTSFNAALNFDLF
ncbi:MAG: tetratricopeptide repeat protein [Candidatus Aegiribacteria sp.]|nr:tetratricopeptide repeat protein [Candidatus Aegiribacteria sp.]